MRDRAPLPMLSTNAVCPSNASMSRKSRESAPGTLTTCQLAPPFVVRTTVPPVPLAQTTLSLGTLNPRRLAVVGTGCAIHPCAATDAPPAASSAAAITAVLMIVRYDSTGPSSARGVAVERVAPDTAQLVGAMGVRLQRRPAPVPPLAF